MLSTGIPWEQEAEYIAACRTVLEPGEQIKHIRPRHTGASPTDVTGFQVGSAYWNINNLPNVCYLLNAPVEWETFRKSPVPGQKRDEAGKLMWERHPWPGTAPRRLLDFPILHNIDTICTQVEWEWLEFIMRLDPRLTWDDIDMRMEYVGARAAHDNDIDRTSENVIIQAVKAKNKFINALQTRCSRGRATFTMLSWRERTKKSKENKTRADVMKQLSPDQIANNTTRGSTPGIINPLLPDTPANRVYRRRAQDKPDSPQNEPLDEQQKRPLRVLAARRPKTSTTVPSTARNRKRKASAASLSPKAIDIPRDSDEGPSKTDRKSSNTKIVDLTQSDDTDASSESSASNNAPTSIPLTNSESSAGNKASTSIPVGDLHAYTNQQRRLERERMQHTPPNWYPASILTRTSNMSNLYPYHPAPPALAPRPIFQPVFDARASMGLENPATSVTNWGQGLAYYHPNDRFAPFTGDQSRHEYLGRGPRL